MSTILRNEKLEEFKKELGIENNCLCVILSIDDKKAYYSIDGQNKKTISLEIANKYI